LAFIDTMMVLPRPHRVHVPVLVLGGRTAHAFRRRRGAQHGTCLSDRGGDLPRLGT
jgi:hypothetical protein